MKIIFEEIIQSEITNNTPADCVLKQVTVEILSSLNLKDYDTYSQFEMFLLFRPDLNKTGFLYSWLSSFDNENVHLPDLYRKYKPEDFFNQISIRFCAIKN